MTFQVPPPPAGEDLKSPAWRDWFYKLAKAFSQAGTIAWAAITLPTESANQFFAGPSSGAAATAAFRSIVPNDLPVVPESKGGTNQTSYTNGQLLIGNTSTGGLSKATLTAGSNVTITNGPGTITIAASGGSGSGNGSGSNIYLQQNFQGF